MVRIGIDLGGTKTEVIALDDRNSELLRRRVPTPKGDYAGTVRTMVELINGAESEFGQRCTIGIGTPGSFSQATGRIKNSNSTWLLDQPLRDDVEKQIGRPVRMTNDANCLALSEALDGAGASHRFVFAAILGTGVGGGIAIDGKVHDGPNAIAGEWGHAQLPWRTDAEIPGPVCYCGKHACIETFLSGPNLARDENNIERYEDRLARGLAMICNILDPDVIVLGGGVSNIDSLYTNVPKLIPKYIFSDTFASPIRRASYGDSSGVRGAAMLWSSEEAARPS
jgi:fructokinase